jgi:hypothetical protein
MRIDPKITAALEETGLPYEVKSETGDKIKFYVGGRLVASMSGSKSKEHTGNFVKTIVAHIRRAGREKATAR